ncbi:Uncharacterised protein [uncultured archaeon]|nr:Uncharacterised protein [uncultured archaeon]
MNRRRIHAALQLVFLALLLTPILFGSNAVGYLENALSDICVQIQDMIPTASMLLVVLGSVLYGSAQLFGNAEIRAKGSVWATSCITGAILGLIIATVAPDILGQLAGTPVNC